MSTGKSDNELWEQLQNQFQSLLKESGVNVDEEYQKELENSLGLTQEEMSKLEASTIKHMTSKVIKVKRVHEDAVIPEYAYDSDSGFDLRSVVELTLPPFERALVPTGLCVEIGENTEIQVRPKSGLAINQGLTVLNTPGTVDSGYNGEIKVIMFNTNNHEVTIEKGMKIGQAVLCPVFTGGSVIIEEVDELGVKDRGSNGFGSTGI
jgi:dUTP pyrophosphatase